MLRDGSASGTGVVERVGAFIRRDVPGVGETIPGSPVEGRPIAPPERVSTLFGPGLDPASPLRGVEDHRAVGTVGRAEGATALDTPFAGRPGVVVVYPAPPRASTALPGATAPEVFMGWRLGTADARPGRSPAAKPDDALEGRTSDRSAVGRPPAASTEVGR